MRNDAFSGSTGASETETVKQTQEELRRKKVVSASKQGDRPLQSARSGIALPLDFDDFPVSPRGETDRELDIFGRERESAIAIRGLIRKQGQDLLVVLEQLTARLA